MLFGVMRLFEEENDGLVRSAYQCKLLLKDDALTRTRKKSSRETILNELKIFKEECNTNEQALVNLNYLFTLFLSLILF